MRSSALAALALVAGCPATGVYRTADPVPPGRWRVGGAVAGGALRDTEQGTRTPTAEAELSVRRGVTRDLDVGARLYTAGVDVSATWRIARGRWSWALAPSLGGLLARETGASPRALDLFGQLAGIASRSLSARWRLTLGPTLGAGLYYPETGGAAGGLWLGGFAGAGVRLGRWWFEPELGVLGVVAGDVPVRGGGVQLGVAVARDL